MREESFSFLYRAIDWMSRLIYLNLLWILFTLMGLGILGFFPATAGLYAVARDWIRKKEDRSIWQVFWTTYKTSFVKSNIIGFIVLIIGWILQIDLRFFQTQDNSILFVALSYFTIFLFVLYIVFVLFLFPVFVHYKLMTLQYLRQTILIVFL